MNQNNQPFIPPRQHHNIPVSGNTNNAHSYQHYQYPYQQQPQNIPYQNQFQPHTTPQHQQLQQQYQQQQQQVITTNYTGGTNTPTSIDAGGFSTYSSSSAPIENLSKNNDYIAEIPVGKGAVHNAKYTTSREFTHTRYSAITSGPDDTGDLYTLRQTEMSRRTKIALVATMYNEDDELLCKSLHAVFQNVAYLCSSACPHSWGPEGWKNFVVVIVADGRTKCQDRVKTVLGCMGLYADVCRPTTASKSNDNDGDDDVDEVNAHMFEYTPQVHYDRELNLVTSSQGFVPVQCIFLMKEKNAKKINSHRWFFNSICKILKPEVTLLLDVGTRPTTKSFYHLFHAFERDSSIGGACGEIAAETGPYCSNLLNPLVATQNFEYKMSGILDKPLESVLGYISVLPGAFSAYRLRAIQGTPLNKYFLGEATHGHNDGNTNLYKANMYLAEDRILCFELVTKENANWLLKYVKSAKAETDVPTQLSELISQRRRWLNGSFFAAVHALVHWNCIYRSGHSLGRKFALTFEFFYNLVNLLFTWFNVSFFYLTFYFLFRVVDLPGNDPFYGAGELLFLITRTIYIFLIVTTLISSLGNRPQGSVWIYTFTVVFFAMLMILMLYMAGWAVAISFTSFLESDFVDPAVGFVRYFTNSPTFRDVVISLASTWGVFILSSTLHMDPWHCFTCSVQYLLVLPAYINLLSIYGFANLHDISWGTKGDNSASQKGGTLKRRSTVSPAQQPIVIPNQDEADSIWRNLNMQLESNRARGPLEEKKRDAKTKQEDYFKLFRTKVVLAWIVSNGAVILVFTSDYIAKNVFNTQPTAVSPFLTFVFWSVAILSGIRFLFSTIYLILHWAERISDTGSQNQSRQKV